MKKNVDYEKLYHIMMNASEDAMRILIEAQRKCEELYLEAGEAEEKVRPHCVDRTGVV